MQFDSKAATSKPRPSIQFLIEPEPWLRIFLRNLADLLPPEPPNVCITAKPAPYWPDALVHRPAPWAAVAQSLGLHILIVAAIYGLTLLWLNQPRALQPELTNAKPIEHYELSEYLPPISKPRPVPRQRRITQKADPEYAPQEIVSVDVGHKSTQQTIINPPSPRILTQDIPLPNIVAWTPVPSVAPVAPKHPLRQLPVAAPPVVPPIEQVAQRKLDALEFPIPAQAVAPAQAPVNRNLAAVDLPAQPQPAVPPSTTAAPRRLGDINFAVNTPSVAEPKLPVPEQQAGNSRESGQAGQPQGMIPPAEPVTSGTGKSESQTIGQLLVLNAQPVAPNGPMTIPEGNRRGEFAAGPTGHVGASGRPEIAAGNNDSAAGGKDGNSSVPGNIFIAEPPKKVTGNLVVSAPLSSAPSARADTHNPVPSREVPGREKIESEVFGGRKYYSMALNMPNLTSSGTSWIVRFAEMNPQPGSAGEFVSAPVALSKVDPAYPPTLMRDRVEGTVILYAVIRSDGNVAEVRVLQGVDDTLDENARDALRKWHFRPGTKNGAPVDLEAVFKIPFRAPRKVF